MEPAEVLGATPMMVCLVGIDGAGKTTHAQELARWLGERETPLEARVCDVWDVLIDPELNRTAFMGKPEDLRRYLVKVTPDARCLFIFHALLESYHRARRSGVDVIILTSYWYKYFVAECLLGAHETVLQPIIRLFAEPDVTLFMDVDPEEAADRREGEWTAYECGLVEPNREAYVDFQQRCRAKLLGLQGSREWERVDASGDQEEVGERLRFALTEQDGRL